MSSRLGSLKWRDARATLFSAPLALVFFYLGLSPQTAVLAAISWIVLGAAGAWLIESLIGGVLPRYRVLLMLGPGPLLGLGLAVFIFLLLRGGPLGLVTVIALAICAMLLWSTSASDVRAPTNSVLFAAVIFGSALLANSKEFPNLLTTSVAVLVVGVVFNASKRVHWRALSAAAMVGALAHDIVTRPMYWWWSSDDTTTLSGIGTMIIERGRVADVSGWSTESHHWLLHAWLALWNMVSLGQVLETYLIAWPLVAAVSMFASLWLCLEAFLGHEVSLSRFVIVSVATAGIVRLEWPAPQEQQPFLFGLVACAALWLSASRLAPRVSAWRVSFGVLLIVVVVPAMLFVLKPSLIVAYGLLLVGSALVVTGCNRGARLVVAVVVSLAAAAAGIFAMWIGGSWISERSFTSFAIDWFPADLGWCSTSSVPGSLACVVSLQVVLIAGTLLAVGVLIFGRNHSSTRVSLLLLLPLVVVYLPLRYFISSGVGSGAPSFYRLSEMAMMLIVAAGLALVVEGLQKSLAVIALLGAAVVGIVLLSRGPSDIYDAVDALVVAIRPLRFVNASDAIALALIAAVAAVSSQLPKVAQNLSPLFRSVSVALCLVSFLPVSRVVADTMTAQIDETRLSRPADFGPADLDAVADWLHHNTKRGTLIATNYLCPEDRLDECTNARRQVACPRGHPWLMASWALTALSEREFLYLSQGWHYKVTYYFSHQTSTRLGKELSLSAARELQELGVSYYVASREHTNSAVWPRLRDAADFSTEHFVVVSLASLIEKITA